MNLDKLNNFLTKIVLWIFISILPLSLLTILFPIFGYLLSFILIYLLVISVINFILSTYLFISDLNKMVEKHFNTLLNEDGFKNDYNG